MRQPACAVSSFTKMIPMELGPSIAISSRIEIAQEKEQKQFLSSRP